MKHCFSFSKLFPLFNNQTLFLEFKFHADQNQRTLSPTTCPLSTVTYVSENSLEGNTHFFSSFQETHCLKIQGFSNISSFVGSGFALRIFPCNVLTPNVFPTLVSINVNEAL
ncbi:hypothetical protein HKD37_10G028788 [Glycine soja]